MAGRETRAPDLDDWFAGSDPARAQPSSGDVEAVDDTVDEDWLAAEESSSIRQRPDAWQLTRWQTVAAAAGVLAIVLAGLAVVGVFSSGSRHPSASTTTTPPTTSASTTPRRPTTGVEPPATTLTPGARGTQVRALQRALVKLGYAPGTIDGAFGPATQRALETFQTASGLAADGVLGTKTLAALTRALHRSG
jgi:Putative peptidoglycan binding domain